MKRYVIAPRWFDGASFEAETAGKAKYAAFKACREALGNNIDFRDFLDGLSVLHMGEVESQARAALHNIEGEA